ncbi:MAG: 2-oxo acid dehydrogenase subunit E2 [Bacteroidales bacterium]|nr:2-oxo acid dehydrogenase subunit E2 [Bacteroidales bacterium]
MASFDIIMPKMGESIEEATITNWFVKEGDKVEEDDVLLEIATDKVDSEIPSPVEGLVKKILFRQDEVVAVGTVIAVIGLDGGDESPQINEEESAPAEPENLLPEQEVSSDPGNLEAVVSSSGRFYSPLVKTIASKESISQAELDTIEGSGINGRVQKKDLLKFIENRSSGQPAVEAAKAPAPVSQPAKEAPPAVQAVSAPVLSGEDEVIEMSRLRKLIAAHMIKSKQTSAHVTNMIEVDVTAVVNWRNRVKDEFLKKEGVKLTFLPVFLEATVKTLREYPQINASVDGERIIIKKKINLGVAVSLPDYNLIVPNIKNADSLNLTGITKRMNELAAAARSNKLGPDDISGGTFTVTNFGSFKNDIGTPIINQPEVAILAIGAIKKKPAVIETEMGDVIAIRQKMWLSLTYDHRIIDGALGGAFLKRLGDYIESFDPESGNFKI